MKHIIILLIAWILSVPAQANPFRDMQEPQVREEVKQMLLKRHQGSYGTVRILLDSYMHSFLRLTTIPSSEINDEILNKLHRRHGLSFPTIEVLYGNEIEAWRELMGGER